MIGLGSNRLTVCRRGGMSVTQAGRGGMEWLGVRMPSWASPYSAQATAYLQQHYAAYWSEIADYGKRNPTMVPYIDEDPDLVCSLMNVGKVRYLIDDSTACIDSQFVPEYGVSCGMRFLVTRYNDTGGDWWMNIYGGRDTTNGPKSFMVQANQNVFRTPLRSNTWASYQQLSINTIYELEVGYKQIVLNGVSLATYNNQSDTFRGTPHILIGGFENNGTSVGNNFEGYIYNFFRKDANGNIINMLIPFVQDGVAKMLDITTLTVKQNIGTFSVGISETPAS